jgi:hypothetical protein
VTLRKETLAANGEALKSIDDDVQKLNVSTDEAADTAEGKADDNMSKRDNREKNMPETDQEKAKKVKKAERERLRRQKKKEEEQKLLQRIQLTSQQRKESNRKHRLKKMESS